MADTAASVKRWYRSARWARMRKAQLRRHPFCQCPHHRSLPAREEASVVDHKEPHRGRARLFWNPSNLQSMAKRCHDRYKQSQEKGGAGFDGACDATGLPLSDSHPWNC